MVIDASALTAYLENEVGAEVVTNAFLESRLMLSVVNFVEVVGKLVSRGATTHDEVVADIKGLNLDVVEMDLDQGLIASYFYARRKPYGLSLGDCACLALAEARGVKVLTGERAWAKLPGLRVEVQLFRE